MASVEYAILWTCGVDGCAWLALTATLGPACGVRGLVDSALEMFISYGNADAAWVEVVPGVVEVRWWSPAGDLPAW
jgi:hypothetical protein